LQQCAISTLQLAHDLLISANMRSILTLFVIAALGFLFILQKKDGPEATSTKKQPTELIKLSQHNWMKHAIDKNRVVAQNVSN
jgi:hypothetical protein